MKVIHVLGDAIDQSELSELSELIARENAVLSRAVERADEVGIASENAMLPAAGRRIADVILEDASNYGADLIVLGSQGNTGWLPGRPPSEP